MVARRSSAPQDSAIEFREHPNCCLGASWLSLVVQSPRKITPRLQLLNDVIGNGIPLVLRYAPPCEFIALGDLSLCCPWATER